MNIDLYSYSNMGARALNEDSLGVKEDENRFAAVLCDGLGGHNRGEIASQTAVQNVLDGISQIKELHSDNIYAVLKNTNDALIQIQAQNPEFDGMRTTAVGCIIEGNKIRYFNSGDSRFYYFSNGSMIYMSKDHSVSQMSVEMGEMTFNNIRFDADRNKLLKVLGGKTDGSVGTVYNPIECRAGDAFLMCSDGFWEYVLEEEMEIDLSKSASAKAWLDYMLVRLLIKHNENNDNFSVIGGILR